MTTSRFLCVFVTYIALSQCSTHNNNDFISVKNDSMLRSNTNDIKVSSKVNITEFFDPEKKILAHKNEMTGECILKHTDDNLNVLKFKHKYNSNMEFSGDEMAEIIGENIRNFCNSKIIILDNFVNDQITRSKRSTSKKQYQGQTQTQFVSFGSKNSSQGTKTGLAEALSQPDLSRATVSGLNGMGQAQSQSSFGDCDDCSGQNNPTYSIHEEIMNSKNIPLFQPQGPSSQNRNGQYPSIYPRFDFNNREPGNENQGSGIELPNARKYPNTYPESGPTNRIPGKQNQGFDIGPSTTGQYPNSFPRSGLNNREQEKQDQGFGVGPSVAKQYPIIYPGSGSNNREPGKQDQHFGIRPSAIGKYPSSFPGSVSNNKESGNQDFGIGPSATRQYPNLFPGFGSNNREQGKQDQGFGVGPSVTEQYPIIYPGSGSNNREPGKQDQHFSIRPSAIGKYPNSFPGSVSNNKEPGNQDFGIGPSATGQYPNLFPGSGSNNREQGKQDQGFGVGPSAAEQYPIIYPGSGSNNREPGKQDQHFGIRPSAIGKYPNSFPGSVSNNKEPGNQDFGIGPSATGQYPNLFPGSGSNNREQGKQDQSFVIRPSTIGQYPLSFPSLGIQGSPDKALPSLCNFLYQTCLNALLYNKNPNIIPTFGSQNIGTTQNIGKPINSFSSPSYPLFEGKMYPNQISNYGQSENQFGLGIQQHGYTPLGGHINPTQSQPGYGQPQVSSGSMGSGIHWTGSNQPGEYVNPNQYQPSYRQPQGSLGSDESGFQQPNKNINSNHGHSQSSLGNAGSGVQQPGSIQSSSNLNSNKFQPSYGQPQGSLGYDGSGFQQPGGSVNQNHYQSGYGKPQGSSESSISQPGSVQSSGNMNSNPFQPSYRQPQGSLGSAGSNIQQPGSIQSSGNINPNKFQPSYEQPQSSLGYDGSGFQQPGGNVNQNHYHSGYGQPQGSLESIQSSGNINPNKFQPSYGQPQGSLGYDGSDFQQPGGSVNQNHYQSGYGKPQGSSEYSVSQPGSVQSGGNINPNQFQPSFRQPHGSLEFTGSNIQQPGSIQSNSNVNPNKFQPSYGQPQGSLEYDGSGFQQPGENVNQNHYQSGYEQSQGSLGSGGSRNQQPESVQSEGNQNQNQFQPSYENPQGSLGSGVQQPGLIQSGGIVNPNQILPGPSQGTLGVGGSSIHQPELTLSSDGKAVLGNPQMNNGNNYLLRNPIIGGQFGTDISSGGSVIPIDTEGGDAQSMTNVNVDGNETIASASAQGKSKTGMTQTQVSGTYSGTGTFSAQAQTSDNDKGAQSQILSNTNGTTSTAQGKGGKGQAQSQVFYNPEDGIALGESQSSGINYGTNTQLQAGIRGGIADAQSTGTGSTSSQAQIGFLPYDSNNDSNQKSIYKGGGTASSQGGSYSGQSQSQLFGSYKHGISYNGAAQASSGSKLRNLPKLNLADAKLKIGQLKVLSDGTNKQNNTNQSLKLVPKPSEYQTRQENTTIYNKKLNINQTNISSTPASTTLSQEVNQNIDEEQEYDSEEEYDDENDTIVNTKTAESQEKLNPKQEQNIILNLDDKHDAQITRDSDSQLKAGQVLDAGQIIPGTNGSKIPDGFRGRVASVAGDQTKAKAIPGGQAQSQTVLLTPGAGGLTVVDKTKLKALLGKESYVKPTGRSFNTFQTNMDGETGKFDPSNKNIQYFTKSSTCGYFSFSCNYVNGAKSGPKICKPNPPPTPCQRNN